MLRIAGVVFALVGLGAGVFLLAGSFGLTPNAPGLSAWVLFPACAFGGLVLAALGSRTGALPGLLGVAGGALLLLALAAAVGLLLSAAGYAETRNGSGSLWYLLGVAGLAGAAWLLAPEGPGGKA
ncbi:MAG TPA: hypothetical protein PLP50_12050 [Thermoanaerobaculia bacterium]|nr:hypothetical protein [Thermoanaerobaculia bacterium]HQN06626.1 hypothetical protein [Thermoanaerobaculia bacterium]HQP89232.1 hypothetical protein [Thermoanaerobaculia bacterium]